MSAAVLDVADKHRPKCKRARGSCHSVLKSQPSPSRRILMGLIAFIILLGVMDGLSAVFLKFVLASTAHFLIWNPNIDAAKVWAEADGKWDDELGWPSPREATAPPRD